MARQMIVNANAVEEIRVAIVENKKLIDLDVESDARTKQKGNIYKGIVANVEDSLEAAFIEFGEDKQGFLALSEVRPALYPEAHKGKSRRKVKISEILTRGQEIIVQVTKDEIGSKGAAVTSYLSIPGRYVVLMHSDDGGGGISRKIDDENARRRARDLLSLLAVPEGMAVIIRTAGMNRPRADLYRDLKALFKTWEQIDRGAELGRAPTLLYREPDLVLRTIRDYLAPDIDKIVIDSEDEFDDAKSYFEERMPDAVNLLIKHDGRQPVFEAYGIERAIGDLFLREVHLKSGGSIVIDQTEALVAIDVNSGKSTKEGDHEATVYKTNLEAAGEVARQLRLRDLGGIVVIDFIDMVSRRHERDVERAVKDAMRADKAKVKVGRISDNGTLEITRQRLRQAHRLISMTPCAHCEGTGVVRDPEGLAVTALRNMQTRLAKSRRNLARLTVRIPLEVANVLSNKKRSELIELETEHQLRIDIIAEVKMNGSEIKFDEEARGRAGLEAAKGISDPRLDRDKRRGRRRDQKPLVPQKSQPPPSIGAVPQWLLSEEDILKGEFVDEPEGKADKDVETFDDELTQMLFGAAPLLGLDEAETPAEDRFEMPQLAKKKRRRRGRRRRGAREGEDQDTQATGDAVAADASGTASNDNAEAPRAESDDKPRRSRRGRRPGRNAAAKTDAASGDADGAQAAKGSEGDTSDAPKNGAVKQDAAAGEDVKPKRASRRDAAPKADAEAKGSDAPKATPAKKASAAKKADAPPAVAPSAVSSATKDAGEASAPVE